MALYIPGTLTISSIPSCVDICAVLKTSEHKDKTLQNSLVLLTCKVMSYWVTHIVAIKQARTLRFKGLKHHSCVFVFFLLCQFFYCVPMKQTSFPVQSFRFFSDALAFSSSFVSMIPAEFSFYTNSVLF